MKRWKKILFSLVIFLIVCGFGYAYYVWNKPARDVSKEKGIQITAVTIYDSFSNNEKAANISFLNKAIEVTGRVSSLKHNQAGQTVVYLHTDDPVFGVNCTFKQNPGNIAVGDSITFKGICTGYLSDVILNQGVLVSNSNKN
jgi:hypothetical protein